MMTTTSPIQRVESIDVFRALTMFLMIFVNDIHELTDIPHWLLHAKVDEDMLGFSDIIFPAFLLVMGMSVPFAIQNRLKKRDSIFQIVWHILSRTFALLVMGIFMVNWSELDGSATGMHFGLYACLMALAFFLIWCVYPKGTGLKRMLYGGMQLLGIALLIYLYLIYVGKDGTAFTPRWWGILGRIGWTYLVCSLAYLLLRDRLWAHMVVWVCFIGLSILNATGILQAHSIEWLLPGAVTLHAFGLAGLTASLLMQRYAESKQTVYFSWMCAIGAVMLVAGVSSHFCWIISKIQNTPTWFFYCCAILFPLFAFFYWLVDLKGKASWFTLLKPAGTAALTCYMIPYMINIRGMMGEAFPIVLRSGMPGLLASIFISLLVVGLTALLLKAKIKLKV